MTDELELSFEKDENFKKAIKFVETIWGLLNKDNKIAYAITYTLACEYARLEREKTESENK